MVVVDGRKKREKSEKSIETSVGIRATNDIAKNIKNVLRGERRMVFWQATTVKMEMKGQAR